jgi:translation initiation factor 3 subunit M
MQQSVQPIHDLLKIFVFEKLEAYIKFFEANKDFVTGLGLKHEDNVRKMKLLSFMQLAENRSEVSFAEIQHSIQIGEDEVEEFLIDVIKTKLVRAKIAQGDNMVHVSSTMHRTFGPGDWQQLHQLLTQWKSNIHTVKEQMQHVASAQVDLMHKKI